MNQQTDMFNRQTPIGALSITPNEHGLFTVDQVSVLAAKRQCVIRALSDYACEVRPEWKPVRDVRIMATDRGLWSPVNVFRACREAVGQPSYTIDYAKAKIKNPGNLDEVRIAEIVGADGVRPYLSRPGQYHFQADAHGNGFYHNPASAATRRLIIGGINVHFDHGVPKVGTWTWPVFAVFCGASGPLTGAGKSYDYRRALRALDDAGLLKLTVGLRGGFGTATFEWLPLAFLPQRPNERKLADIDAEYLAAL